MIGGGVEAQGASVDGALPGADRVPPLDAANAWYDSPEYAPLKWLRHGAGRFNTIFIAGLPDPR